MGLLGNDENQYMWLLRAIRGAYWKGPTYIP